MDKTIVQRIRHAAMIARMRVTLAVVFVGACAGGHSNAGGQPDAPAGGSADAPMSVDAPVTPNTLDGNRDRLLATYLVWLQTQPTVTQSNGLVGGQLHDVCDLWSHLDPSAQNVFRTITHRLWGSVLHVDGSHELEHLTKLYRVIGGQSATSSSAGSCGGGEYNRMFFHMDAVLHDAQLAAFQDQGASPHDIADITASSAWRNSQDLGGPHTPFDTSDETIGGAPRGQTQYFRDPTSTAANAPLGRMDLTTLVDPYALEVDQDYDCTHNSNPDCSYIFYGAACAPGSSQLGTQIYIGNYGDFEATYKPAGC
jgi:hypothetical protein